MKKILSLMLCVAIALTMTVIGMTAVHAETVVSGDYAYEMLTDGNIVITGYSGYDSVLEIPAVLDGYAVEAIGDWAFVDCDFLVEVTIPEGVTELGYGSFWNCAMLEHVSVPETLSSLGEWSFNGCICLTDITLPASINEIGEGVFAGCSALQMEIPDTVIAIGRRAFIDTPAMTSVTIGRTVTVIGEEAFGYLSDGKGAQKRTDFTIVGYRNTAAQRYAEENELPFSAIDNYVIGDADRDGEVTIFDATRIQRYLAELVTQEDIDLDASDVDGDGEVTIFDTTRIQRYLAQLSNLDGTPFE